LTTNSKSDNYIGYVPSLDGLRAIAVILVMLVHAHFYFGKNGQIGVSVFFTLSGFLITTLLLEEFDKNKSVSFLGFYTRRTMRLFPALYALLGFVIIYTLFFKSSSEQSIIYKEVLSAVFYVNNISWKWGWGNSALLLGHTWSLAVEEQFYLIWPCILVFVIKRNLLKPAQYGLILFIIISWVFKSKGIYPDIVSSIIQESIFIGCLGAILRWNYNNIRIHQIIVLIFLLLILIIGILPITLPFNFFNLCAILSIIVIIGLVNNEDYILNKYLSIKPMVFIGKISYSLYLWHVIIFRLFTWHSPFSPSVTFITKFIVTFLAAIASWYLIEQKATALGRKWSKKIENNKAGLI
jgi:peptidoglycan/LPS O-acetylase OafA/YrhL